MEEVGKIKNSDRATYQEGVDLLQREAEEDDHARAKYGTDRWTRPPSRQAGAKLYTQVEEIEGYLKSAQSSDELVEKKIQGCEEMLRLLAGPRRDLEGFVPSSQRATTTPKLQHESAMLKNVLVNANKLEARRQRFIDGVKAKAKADDISNAPIPSLYIHIPANEM